MSQPSAQRSPNSMSASLNGLFFLSLSACGLVFLYLLQNPGYLAFWDVFGLISLGFIGIWRWSWFLFRVLRSRLYLYLVFPRWRQRANRVPRQDLPHMCFLVPTYKEQPWITQRVFRAIAQEAQTLPRPITLLVNSSSDEENAAIRAVLEATDPGLKSIRLIQMTQKDGKRKAMADALRELARLELPSDTVIALMDGDSELAPGTLRRCLPFFRLFPQMGALTTDELPVVQGSYLFSEWFHLRFAQRHCQMCSDALSKKVMCLTGRFSLFRATVALAPSFADQLEHDSLQDWLWGQFKFLSGDDKSTWFWLLQRGYDMLYVPDTIVYSIETVSGSVIDRAYSNMRRWYGNMLRNSSRAIALGPRKTGWFTWYSLIDQRISFWTCLITPGFLLLSLLRGHWMAAGVVLSWICFSRPLVLSILFWKRPSIAKPVHFPLLLASQWGSSLVKIWTQMNLAQQSWANRGGQQLGAAGTGMRRFIKQGTARFLLMIQLFTFVVVLSWLSGLLNPAWDLAGLRLNHQATVQQRPLQVIEAIDHGVWPNDGQDDAATLQNLVATFAPDQILEIRLPVGELDLFQPIIINRGDIKLVGQGPGRTILQSHVRLSNNSAALQVQPSSSSPTPSQAALDYVYLDGFTLQHADPDADQAPSIRLKHVTSGALSRLLIKSDNETPFLLEQADNVRVEYVSVNPPSEPRPDLVTYPESDPESDLQVRDIPSAEAESGV
ncbi:MAG: glycosyltransferase [Elainellaceae cyanobacterium]